MVKLKQIKYDRAWDKLAKPEHHTVRNQFDYKFNPPRDKQAYYQTGELYEQLVAGKLHSIRKLIGLELSSGSLLGKAFLLDDVTYQGKPDMEWYEKIRKMPNVMVLHFKEVKV